MKKKIILSSIIAAVCVIAIIVISVVAITQSGGSSSKKSKKQDYKKVAEDFTQAVKSEKNMDEFLDKYLDKKALYASVSDDVYSTESVDEYMDLFEKKMKEATDDEVEDAVETYISGFEGYARYGLKIKLKDTETQEPKDYKDFKYLTATYEDDEGEELCFYFEFYKDKLIMISSDGSLDYTYYEQDEDDDYESTLTRAEKKKINERIEKKLESGNKLKGSEVKKLIDEIIKINEENVENEIFITIYTHMEDVDDADLWKASYGVRDNYSKENVKLLNEELEKAKKLFDDSKYYYCLQSLDHGLVNDISIDDYTNQDDF